MRVRVCACGRDIDLGDRFCARCGASVPASGQSSRSEPDRQSGPNRSGDRLGSAAGIEVEDSDDEVFVDGLAGDRSVRSVSDVRSPGRLRWLVGVCVLGLAFVGFTRWQAGAPGSDADAVAEVASAEEPGGRDGGVDTPESTRSIADDREAIGDGTISGSGSAASIGDADGEQRPVGGPILGEETGLGVVLGDTSQRLLLLNLDSGEEYGLAAKGDLIAIFGKSLVLRSGPKVRLVGLNSADDEGQLLLAESNGYVDVIAIDEELIWVTNVEDRVNSGGLVATGFNESGEQIAEMTIDPSLTFPGWEINGDLFQTTGGGIYRREDGGFRRLSTGMLVAVGKRVALALECDDRMTCRYNWYDKDDWGDPLGLPPPQLSGQGWATVQAGDRWLVEANWQTEQTTLIEVATGEAVRQLSQQGPIGSPSQQVPISPNGRWLLEPKASGILFVDLDTAAEWPYESDEVSWGMSGIFVDLDAVGLVP